MPKKSFAKTTFRPLKWLPVLSVAVLVATTILTYSLFLASFGLSRDLVMSRVLSVGCDPILLATFVPNVATLGFGTGFAMLAMTFGLKHLFFDRNYKPRLSRALAGIAWISLFMLVWMLAFPTGRGFPWDLFHQVTAGIGVAGFLVYAIADSGWMSRRRTPLKKVVAGFIAVTSVAMAATFFLEMFDLSPADLFASFQFSYMAGFFAYVLLLTDDSRFEIGIGTKGRR
jgi:hypothetical protein